MYFLISYSNYCRVNKVFNVGWDLGNPSSWGFACQLQRQGSQGGKPMWLIQTMPRQTFTLEVQSVVSMMSPKGFLQSDFELSFWSFDRFFTNILIWSVSAETTSAPNAVRAEPRTSRALLGPTGHHLPQLVKKTYYRQPASHGMIDCRSWNDLQASSAKPLWRSCRAAVSGTPVSNFMSTSEMTAGHSWCFVSTKCLLLSESVLV